MRPPDELQQQEEDQMILEVIYTVRWEKEARDRDQRLFEVEQARSASVLGEACERAARESRSRMKALLSERFTAAIARASRWSYA